MIRLRSPYDREIAAPALPAFGALIWLVAMLQPLGAVVWVWDGVFIGVGDSRYLAGAMVAAAAVAAGVLLAVFPLGWGLPGEWWGIATLLLGRGVTLGWRRMDPTDPSRPLPG